MKVGHTSAAIFVIVILSAGCVVSGRIQPTLESPTAAHIARLWQEPVDLAGRDLFHGPGGPELMPDNSKTFTFIREDQAGYSAGYDVRGPDGMEWSVKLGPEAQPEVASSRVLWAAERMARLTDAQWDDVFRAAGYREDQRRRYIATITSKIAEGLKLANREA